MVEIEGSKTFSKKHLYLSGILLLFLLAYLWASPQSLKNSDFLYFIAGIVFAYRFEAYFYAPYWTWGGYYVSFFEEIYLYLLLAFVFNSNNCHSPTT